MRFNLKLDGLTIDWKGPNETPPDRCSFCEAPFKQDDAPLCTWSSDGWAASFCDRCADKYIEVERDA